MAQISSNILQGLSSPSFGRGMFSVGEAIGGIPGQMKAKKKQDKFNEIMKRGQALLASAEPDPVALSGVAQELQGIGYTQEAQQFADASRKRGEQAAQRARLGGLLTQASTSEGITPEYAQDFVATGGTLEQLTAASKRVQDEEKRLREIDQLKNLRAAAVAKATKARDPFKRTAMENAGREELLAYLNPALYQMNAGMALVDAEGTTIAERGFKPDTTEVEYDQQTIKDADGNETLLLLTDNKVVGRIEVTPRGNETQEEARARTEAIPKLIHNIGKLDNLLLRDDLPSGLGAQLTRNIGGVEALGYEAAALDVEAEYQQIKNFLGLDNIRVLKQLGGGSTGLGAVSNLELTALQNSIETLNTSRSEEAQREALKNIKKHLNTMLIMAQGRDLTEAVNWNSDNYAKLGYRSVLNKKNETVVFYQEPGTGRKFVYDRTTATFKPLSSGE